MAAAAVSFNITDLNQFTVVADEYITHIFMENLSKVFEYQSNNIHEILIPKKLQVLKNIRTDLLDKAATDIEQFQNKTPKALGRKNKADIINDILILGKVLTRSTNQNEIESLFSPDSSTPDEQDQICKLKAELETIKGENDALRSENDDLKNKLLNCQAALGISIDILKADESKPKNDEVNIVTPVRAVTTKNTAVPVKSVNPKDKIPEKTLVYIGNIDPACSRMSIVKHFTDKLNIDMSLPDIVELPNRKFDKRNFRVSVPSDRLHHATSNWPSGVVAEPYLKRVNKTNVRYTHNNYSSGQKFRWFTQMSHHRHNRSPDANYQSNYYYT